jgi:SAM-dependent methyltransferase
MLGGTYPTSAEAVRASALADAWWYYSVELVPGVITKGQYAPDLPMLPRLMLRRCAVNGMSCLDIGSMEGLVPVLLKRRGARDVLAVDYANHSLAKLLAVQHYHGVDFGFRKVGLMYRLYEQIGPRGFDLINLSGLLYHVFSPLTLLAAARPLLKRGGLMVVSVPLTLDPGYVMDFNAGGRLQSEANTFWYPSARLFDYLLRYMRLEPIDLVFMPHAADAAHGAREKPSGYTSIVCRAVDSADVDDWMRDSASTSWEYRDLSDWGMADRQPVSSIAYHRPDGGNGPIDLEHEVSTTTPVLPPAEVDDSHALRLDAIS